MEKTSYSCLVVDDDEFSLEAVKELISQADSLDLKGTCTSGAEAFNMLSKKPVDILFLDIEMPGMTGLELIRNLDKKPVIILVTAKSDYAVESYEYEVADYLVKPIRLGKFLKAVSKAEQLIQANDPPPVNGEIYVKSNGVLVRVKFDEILWIESLGNYVNIYTEDKKHTVLSSMKEIEKKLTDINLKRIHRFFIVNLNKIESIEENTILIKEKFIPISKSHRSELFKALNQL